MLFLLICISWFSQYIRFLTWELVSSYCTSLKYASPWDPIIEEALLLTPHLNKAHAHCPAYLRWWKKNANQATSLFVSWHGTYVQMPFPLISRTNGWWVGTLQVTSFSTPHQHIIIVIIHCICVVLLSTYSQAYSPWAQGTVVVAAIPAFGVL